MKTNQILVRLRNNFWDSYGFSTRDILAFKVLCNDLNIRDGEIVKITVEKVIL